MANIKLPPGEWRIDFPDTGAQRNVRILPQVGSDFEPIENSTMVIVTNTVTGQRVEMHPGEELLPNGQIRPFENPPSNINLGGPGESRPAVPGSGGLGPGGPIRTVGPSPERPGGGRQPEVIVTEFEQRQRNDQLGDEPYHPE